MLTCWNWVRLCYLKLDCIRISAVLWSTSFCSTCWSIFPVFFDNWIQTCWLLVRDNRHILTSYISRFQDHFECTGSFFVVFLNLLDILSPAFSKTGIKLTISKAEVLVLFCYVLILLNFLPALRHEFHDLFCAQIFLRFYFLTLLLTKEYIRWQWLTWLLFIFQHFGFFLFEIHGEELPILQFPLLALFGILKRLNWCLDVDLLYLLISLLRLRILVNFCLDLRLIVHFRIW